MFRQLMRQLLWLLPAALLLANPCPVAAQWIEDSANLFSPAARDQAVKAIDDLDERFDMGLWVETFAQLPPERQQAYESRKASVREGLFREWAVERANANHVQGLYVLIWKDARTGRGPFRVRVVARSAKATKVFGTREQRKVEQVFQENIDRQHADDALRLGVRFVGETLTDAARPAFHWLWLVGVLAGFAAIWIVAGLVRARLRGEGPVVARGLILPPIGGGLLGGMLGIMGRYPVNKDSYFEVEEHPSTSCLPTDATTLPHIPSGPVEETRPFAG